MPPDCPARVVEERRGARSAARETTREGAFRSRYTIAAMRRWSEVAERVAATTRTSEKTALLADYLGRLPATDLPTAAVFFTGRPFSQADQRATGLGWATIATAVTRASDAPADAIARAYARSSDLGQAVAAGMLIGDIGETAVLAATDRLAEAAPTLFHPLKYMLASPAEDADEIIARLGPTVWVEDKYDGIRAQLHRRGSSARLYSRDLHDVSGQFPEIVRGAADLAWEGILDGEVLAYLDGIVLPVLALQTRLGRKDPSLTLQATVPVIFVAWDVLVLDRAEAGTELEPLLSVPLRERRQRLESLRLPLADDGGVFALSHLMTLDSAERLEEVFLEEIGRAS